MKTVPSTKIKYWLQQHKYLLLVSALLIPGFILTKTAASLLPTQYPAENYNLLYAALILLFVTVFLFIYLLQQKNRAYQRLLGAHKNLQGERDRVQSAISRRNEELELTLTSGTSMVYRVLLDEWFTLLYCSDNLTEVLGYTMKEIFEKNFWYSRLHPDDQHIIEEGMPVLLKNGVYCFEYRFLHGNGNWIWIRSDVKCIYDAGGQPIELVGTLWDITEQRKRQEVERKQWEEVNRLLQSSAAILFRVKANDSFDGLFTSANLTQHFGYTPEETYVPSFWMSNLYPGDQPAIMASVPKLFSEGKVVNQYRFRHKNGSWKWVQAEAETIYDPNGAPSEIVGSFWDITPQKISSELLRISEERFQMATRASKDSIFDWDVQKDEAWMNEAFFETLGYPMDTVMNYHWFIEKIHPGFREEIVRSLHNCFEEKSNLWKGEYLLQKADGSYAFIASRSLIQYNADGQPGRVVGTLTDLTEMKAIENELRKAKEIAEASVQAKGEFLANMSHEIRTPLNGIIGMTELVLTTSLTPEQRHYLNTVNSSSAALMSLINDILDFSKMDAGKMDINLASFSLRDELPQILKPLGLKASEKKLEFFFHLHQDVPDLLVGDSLRLQQIITNLCANAIKFTEQGQVMVTGKVHTAGAEEIVLHFTVADTGIGIDKDKIAYIFQEFAQADNSSTRKYGGTGLGLAITGRLVKLMGGRIWVTSTLGQGSTFHFTVKLKHQSGQRSTSFQALPLLENTPVLVVEDNAYTSRFMVEMLQRYGMKPLAVTSGEEALTELCRAAENNHPFPLVLLDILLSGKIDGYEVAEKIVAKTTLGHPEIIVVSMSQDVRDRQVFARLGVKHFFSKPFSQNELMQAIQNTLLVSPVPPQHNKNVNGAAYETPNPVQKRGLKILVVDDNLINQEVAIAMLSRNRHVVETADNGLKALEAIRENWYDAVLMDVQMPVMNGYEATRQIRLWEKERGGHLPIIGLTASAMMGDRQKCFEAGMDDYITKPMHTKDLEEVFERLVRKQGEEVESEEAVSALIPETALFDLDKLMSKIHGDKVVLEKLLSIFIKDGTGYFSEIEKSVEVNHVQGLQYAAHTLKGICLNLEMKSAYNLSAQIEELAIKEKMEDVRVLVPSLKQTMNAMRHQIEKIRG